MGTSAMATATRIAPRTPLRRRFLPDRYPSLKHSWWSYGMLHDVYSQAVKWLRLPKHASARDA